MIDHSCDAVRIDVRETLMTELHTCNTRGIGARTVLVEIVQRFAESAICDYAAVIRYMTKTVIELDSKTIGDRLPSGSADSF